MFQILAAVCETCGKEPIGWPGAILGVGLAFAAAWFFVTALKRIS